MKQRLIIDAAESMLQDDSFTIDCKKRRNCVVQHFKLDEDHQKKISRDVGDYYTICYDKNILFQQSDIILKELSQILRKMLKSYRKLGTTLVIGLGNSSVLADALGPMVNNRVIATNQYDDFMTIPKVALFSPEVTYKTGINSFHLISMVVKDLKPDTIILIDSLATKKKERLNYAIEVSDAGIVPGSALHNNKEISKRTFGIPVLAIGVPTIMDINGGLYSTPDIKDVLTKTSEVIAHALNRVLTL